MRPSRAFVRSPNRGANLSKCSTKFQRRSRVRLKYLMLCPIGTRTSSTTMCARSHPALPVVEENSFRFVRGHPQAELFYGTDHARHRDIRHAHSSFPGRTSGHHQRVVHIADHVTAGGGGLYGEPSRMRRSRVGGPHGPLRNATRRVPSLPESLFVVELLCLSRKYCSTMATR